MKSLDCRWIQTTTVLLIICDNAVVRAHGSPLGIMNRFADTGLVFHGLMKEWKVPFSLR